MELLPAAGEELNAALLVDAEVAAVCSVEGEAEVDLLSAAGEELDAAEVLSPTLGKLEDVAVFGEVDDKAGVLEVLCPADDDTVFKLVSTGKTGSWSILRFRKSLPYLSIFILKNQKINKKH